uniref:Uncharacterized protein n=1 Tax=Solanum tuberosum TaxID=4113 RepID=M1DJL3_SOLTU
MVPGTTTGLTSRGPWAVGMAWGLGFQHSKASSRAFPRAVAFTTGREVASEVFTRSPQFKPRWSTKLRGVTEDEVSPQFGSPSRATSRPVVKTTARRKARGDAFTYERPSQGVLDTGP